MSSATGGGRGRCMETRKVNIKNEKKNNTEDAENHRKPAYNSGNASCATNEEPDYPDQPRDWAGGEGRAEYVKTIPNQAQENKQTNREHTSRKPPPTRKLGKRRQVEKPPARVQENVKKKYTRVFKTAEEQKSAIHGGASGFATLDPRCKHKASLIPTYIPGAN